MNPTKDDTAIAKQLRQIWLCSVSELADIELQRKMWLDAANTNPHWSYVEFRESYPDAEQLLDGLNRGYLTKDQFDVLDALGNILRSHQPPGNRFYDHAAVLDDPAWHRVVTAAAHAQQRLLSIIEDPSERQILLSAI